MKATGIVRRIDDLGRVVIPKEMKDAPHSRGRSVRDIYRPGRGSDPEEIFADRRAGEFRRAVCREHCTDIGVSCVYL